MILATSSAQGFIAAITLIGYTIALSLLIAVGLVIYAMAATYHLRQERQLPPVTADTSDRHPVGIPQAARPGATSPTEHRRSRA